MSNLDEIKLEIKRIVEQIEEDIRTIKELKGDDKRA